MPPSAPAARRASKHYAMRCRAMPWHVMPCKCDAKNTAAFLPPVHACACPYLTTMYVLLTRHAAVAAAAVDHAARRATVS